MDSAAGLPEAVPPRAEWDVLPEADQIAVARNVRRRLPAGWAFLGVEAHEMAGQRHRIAFFRWRRTRFARIPGGTATLGYDRAHPFGQPQCLPAPGAERARIDTEARRY